MSLAVSSCTPPFVPLIVTKTDETPVWFTGKGTSSALSRTGEVLRGEGQGGSLRRAWARSRKKGTGRGAGMARGIPARSQNNKLEGELL